MVKKVLSSLATLTLIAGSVTTTTAWTEHKNQNAGDKQKQNPQSSQNYNITNNTNFTKNSSFPPADSLQIYSYNGVFYSYGNINADLYESFDNGKTWVKNLTIDPGTLAHINLVYGYDNFVYVSVVGLLGNSGLYESQDNGKTFTKNSFNPGAGFVGSIYGYKNIVYLVS